MGTGYPAEGFLRHRGLILTAAGQPVRSADDLYGALAAAAAAGSVELTVLRGTEERTVLVAFSQDGPPAAEA